MEPSEQRLIDRVWQYPLFRAPGTAAGAALPAGRRSPTRPLPLPSARAHQGGGVRHAAGAEQGARWVSRFLAFGDEHYQLVDDKTGKPAGVGKWVESGYLNGEPHRAAWPVADGSMPQEGN